MTPMQGFRRLQAETLPGCYKSGNRYHCDTDLAEKEIAELREAEKARTRADKE